MKYYGCYRELPIKYLFPGGWQKNFLQIQKDGLTGNIEKAGFPFNTLGWDNFKKEFGSEEEKKYVWTSYEQTAYALDGQIKCALLLNDEDWTEQIENKLEQALRAIDSDGYIGPPELKDPAEINRWPHVVFFRAVKSYYDATQDARILHKLCEHYLKKPVDYTYGRNVLNVEIMLWLYDQTGTPELLNMAEKTFKEFDANEKDSFSSANLLSRKKSHSHGVSFNEIVKLGALLYQYTGNAKYLNPVIKGYNKVFRYQMLPDGLHSCNENMSNNHYMMTHELCNVTDFSRAMSILVKTTGEGKYADRAERCVYNAGIGAICKDFKAIQYFSGLNQIIADDHSNHNWYKRGTSWMAYRPNHITPCCTGNSNRFMPEFLLHSFLQSENGIAAVYYGDNSFCGEWHGQAVTIKEESKYPFEDAVRFYIDSETSFGFSLRIPSWCCKPLLKVNNSDIAFTVKKGFTIVNIEKGHTEIVLEIPSRARFVEYSGGVFVEKGPLLFALGCKEKRELSLEDNGIETQYPKWNMQAASPWNYAVEREKGIEEIKRDCTDFPWNADSAPVVLEIYARRLLNWKMKVRKKIKTADDPTKKDSIQKEGKFVFTPPFPAAEEKNLGEEEKITLVPFGATLMRISVFPLIK